MKEWVTFVECSASFERHIALYRRPTASAITDRSNDSKMAATAPEPAPNVVAPVAAVAAQEAAHSAMQQHQQQEASHRAMQQHYQH